MHFNKGIYYAGFTALLWGFLAIALKVSLHNLSPVTVTWMRFIIAWFCLLLIYIFFDRPKLQIFRRPPVGALIAGAFLGLNYLGFISGVKLTTPAISQIFIQAGPVLLSLVGVLFFHERLARLQMVGIAILLGGYLLFYREQILVLADNYFQYRNGVLWTLFGAGCWAGYAITQKLTVRKHHPMQLNLIIFGLPALAYIPFTQIEELLFLKFWEWAVLIFLGLNTFLAYGSLSYALKYLDANRVSAIIVSNPTITFITMALLGYLEVSWIAPEQWSVLTIVAAITILLGVIIVVTGRSRT